MNLWLCDLMLFFNLTAMITKMVMGKWNLWDTGTRGQSSGLENLKRRNLGSKPLLTAKLHIHEGNSDNLAKKKKSRQR